MFSPVLCRGGSVMKFRLKSKAFRVNIKKLLLCCSTVLLLCFVLHFNITRSPRHPFTLSPSSALGAEKWSGVDESVVERFAAEHGREAREPLINTDQGDLLLFVFLLAGAAGGFVAGYYWRMLIAEQRTKGKERSV